MTSSNALILFRESPAMNHSIKNKSKTNSTTSSSSNSKLSADSPLIMSHNQAIPSPPLSPSLSKQSLEKPSPSPSSSVQSTPTPASSISSYPMPALQNYTFKAADTWSSLQTPNYTANCYDFLNQYYVLSRKPLIKSFGATSASNSSTTNSSSIQQAPLYGKRIKRKLTAGQNANSSSESELSSTFDRIRTRRVTQNSALRFFSNKNVEKSYNSDSTISFAKASSSFPSRNSNLQIHSDAEPNTIDSSPRRKKLKSKKEGSAQSTPKPSYTDWESLPDYCPSAAQTLAPNNSRALSTEWKGQSMNLNNDSIIQKLHPAEIHLASVLRLPGNVYMDSKRRLFLEKFTRFKKRLPFRRTDAQKACRIDVNKASRLFAAYEKAGWLNDSHFEKFLNRN